jgi:hypothetical protein
VVHGVDQLAPAVAQFSLRERIDEWGYPPEDSLGFCPTFTNRGIYFAWCEP